MSFTRSIPAKAGRPVSFPRWWATLATAKLSADERWRYATEIRRFLKYCQILNAPMNRSRAREYLAIVPLVAARPDARCALRWYFRAARVARNRRHADGVKTRPRVNEEEVTLGAPSPGWPIPGGEETAFGPDAVFAADSDYP